MKIKEFKRNMTCIVVSVIVSSNNYSYGSRKW